MSETTAAGHLSIGEVLSLVQEDFPDVTISKIRFLESQGLIAPERTGSGYRKFYGADIDRLRWILRQQRDHFLPLKVIKKMLDQGVDMAETVDTQPTLWSTPADDEAGDNRPGSASTDADDTSGGAAGAPGRSRSGGSTDSVTSPAAPSGPTSDSGATDSPETGYRSRSHPAVASAPPKVGETGAGARSLEQKAGGTTHQGSSSAGSGTARPTAPEPDSPRTPRTAAERTTAATSAAGSTGSAARTRSDRSPADAPASATGAGTTHGSGRVPASQGGSGADPDVGQHAGPAEGFVASHVDAGSDQPTQGERRVLSTPADVVAALQEDPRSRRKGRRAGTATPTTETPEDPALSPEPAVDTPAPSSGRVVEPAVPTPPLTALLSAEELCELCEISPELLAGLEQYGLIVPAQLGGRSAYDAEAVDVARFAAKYAELGVEPRHLRMYKVSAEREAGFIEQLVVPLIKQRNPAARQQAVDRSDDLIAMGADLHAALLRRQLARVLGT